MVTAQGAWHPQEGSIGWSVGGDGVRPGLLESMMPEVNTERRQRLAGGEGAEAAEMV